MRHRKLSRRFSRTSSHRIAMMRNLSISLIEHEVIKTTVEKGKELRRFFEPLITRAKEDNLHNRRLVISELNSTDAVSKLFSDLGPRFKETNGGYLRLIKAGFREGDKADVCYVELTCREESEKELLDEAVLEEKLEAKEEVKVEEPKAEEPKAEESAKEEVKVEEPKAEESAKEEPKAEETAKKKEKPKESWWSRFFK
ncbi:MAG: 50S ribosomal protein L17 [Gammaproteobacteria bacterium]|nr:50S ribosomal protein L17 [Gammaproteobacteria bacterium]